MPNDIARNHPRRFFSVFPIALSSLLVLGAASGASAGATDAVPAGEKKCLATAIYFEARSESEQGQKSVAQVILNRVEHDAYPDTICAVVFQNHERRNACQFSFACDGRSDQASEPKAWKRAVSLAGEVLEGRNLVQSVRTATHYHATYVNPSWAPKMTRLSKIGRHIFYRS